MMPVDPDSKYLTPDAKIGGVYVTLTPKGYGVGNVSSFVYGPILVLTQEQWGTVWLAPRDALALADWILTHRELIEPPTNA